MKNVSDNFNAEFYVLSEYAMKNTTFHLKKPMTFNFTFIKNSAHHLVSPSESYNFCLKHFSLNSTAFEIFAWRD